VRRLRLDGLAIGRHEHARHEAKRTEALRDGVGLNVAVVVLARPDVSTLPLHGRGDHVVDQPVLVGDASGLELLLVLGVEHLLEDVLERAVVRLEDRVLGRQVHRVLAQQSVGKRGAGEVRDGVIEVVHPHHHAATAWNLGDGELHGVRAVGGRERHRHCARAWNLEIGRFVLVAVGVTADDDRLGPARDQPRDVRDDDGLAEDHATKDVADGAVGRLPHLLEAKLIDARLIWRDRGAFDANAVLLDGVGRIDRDLVARSIARLDREVVVLDVHIKVGMNQAVLDELPHDSGHFVAIKLNDSAFYLDLRHAAALLNNAAWVTRQG